MRQHSSNMDIWPHLEAVLVKTFTLVEAYKESKKEAAKAQPC